MVHNQDLKPTAYKTLIRPQLEYASTVCSPHTATDIYKLESVQCRAAGGLLVNTGKPLALPQCLETSTGVDQRHIDSRLVKMYKVAYDIFVSLHMHT